MGRWLFLLFVLVPAVELVLLIEIGKVVGAFATMGLIFVTGVVGASLARAQGLTVLRRVQAETAAGGLPAESLVDGVIILVAGALLITPGVLTDVVGFLCLVPLTRRWVKKVVWTRLQRSVRQGRVQVHVAGRPASPSPPDSGPPPSQKYRSARVYDVEPEFGDVETDSPRPDEAR